MSWAYQKVALAETDNVLRFSRGRFFVSTFNNFVLRDEVVECWNKKSSPGFSKKNSHATWQASNSCNPLQPLLQSCNWKGVNVPNMNGFFLKADGDNPKETTLKLGGTGGSHAWIYNSIGWLFFMKNTEWNEGLSGEIRGSRSGGSRFNGIGGFNLK